MIRETIFAQLYPMFILTLLVAAFGLIAVVLIDHGPGRARRRSPRLGEPATQP